MEINDGKNIEVVCLGKATASWDGRYLPYAQAMEQVRREYDGNPSDPGHRFANDLHALVALELDLDDWSELELFSAVGSALDFYHGVDAFFCFRGRVVTIDGTVNPNKVDAKADFVLNFDLDPAELQVKAGHIASALR